MPQRARTAIVIGVLLPLAACTTPASPDVAQSGKPQAVRLASSDAGSGMLPLRVPIRGVMAGIIDFSAHGVFESATSEIPLSENDWLAAGLASINLISSSSLITSPGTGPHDAEWVSDPEWRRFAQTMQSASISAGLAITKRDRPALLSSANRLADACQSCHQRFRPEAPMTNSQFAESVRRGLNLGP